jgi:hypothetical protein
VVLFGAQYYVVPLSTSCQDLLVLSTRWKLARTEVEQMAIESGIGAESTQMRWNAST